MRRPANVGSYELLQELSSGSMGAVFEARQTQTGERVAVKMLHSSTPKDLYDIKSEFRAVRDLNSPYVAPIYALFHEGEVSYIVMPRIDGVRIDEWIRTFNWRDAPQRLFCVLHDVLSGIADLHRAGIIHRDIKPQNIMVQHNDDALIVDFGVAMRAGALGQGTPVSPQEISGTFSYMPPEVLKFSQPSASHDIFAFGATVFELVTGLVPPRRRSSWEVHIDQAREMVSSTWPQAPAALGALILRMLAADPKQRGSAEDGLCGLGELQRAEQRFTSPRFAPATAVVGRDAELQQLAQLLEHKPCIVMVNGPSGIGKTTLVRQALTSASSQAHARITLAGACHPGEHVPFRTLDEVLDELSQWLLTRAQERSEVFVCAGLSLLASAFPAFEQLRSEGVEWTAVACDLSERRSRLGRALADVLRRVLDDVDITIWIDDVQWADEDGGHLLVEAFRLLGEAAPRLVVSGTRCPEYLDGLEFQQLTLGPLALQDAIELTYARGHAMDPMFSRDNVPVWQINAGAGNPGLLCQLAEYLSSNEIACQSLVEVVAQRSRELQPSAVELVQAMALFGHPTPAQLIRAFSGAADYRALIQTLARIGWVRPSPAFGADGFALPHDNLRRAILGELPSASAVMLHERLARELDGMEDVPLEMTAAHWEHAGVPRRAYELLLIAGDKALSALAFEHAVHCFERVRALAAPADLHVVLPRLANALVLAGRVAEAAEHFVTCARHTQGRSRDEHWQRAATNFLLAGDNERGIEIVRSLLRAEHIRLPRTQVGVVLGVARQRLRQTSPSWDPVAKLIDERHARIADLCYDVSTGLSHADVALGAFVQTLHLRHGLCSASRPRIARALALESGYLATSGQHVVQARALLQRARDVVRDSADPRTLALFCLIDAILGWTGGSWTSCIQGATEAERIAEKDCTGAWWEIGMSRSLLQDALRWCGRYQDLAGLSDRYVQDARHRGDRFALATYPTRFLATLHLLNDEPGRAWQACDSAREWRARGVHLQHLAEFHSRAECLLYQGRRQTALDYVEASVRKMRWAPLLMNATPRAKMFHQLAACRLARAADLRGRERQRLIRGANAALSPVRNAGWHYTTLLADMVEVTSDVLEGRALRHELSDLRKRARDLNMHQYEAALELVMPHSPASRAAAAQTLNERGVKDPQRWAAVLLPGLIH